MKSRENTHSSSVALLVLAVLIAVPAYPSLVPEETVLASIALINQELSSVFDSIWSSTMLPLVEVSQKEADAILAMLGKIKSTLLSDQTGLLGKLVPFVDDRSYILIACVLVARMLALRTVVVLAFALIGMLAACQIALRKWELASYRLQHKSTLVPTWLRGLSKLLFTITIAGALAPLCGMNVFPLSLFATAATCWLALACYTAVLSWKIKYAPGSH